MNNSVDMKTEPKSDQKNFDDFLTGPQTITITKVVGSSDNQQPISVHYEGDDNKPWKPCLSMRRVLVAGWGKKAIEYVGKSVTLFGDPNVMWAGEKVGGIRISHMSHLKNELDIALTASRGKRKPFHVNILEVPMGNVDEEIDYQELMKKGQDSAAYGSTEYKEFFMSLSKSDKKRLDDSGDHEKLKTIAKKNDKEIPADHPTSQDEEAGTVDSVGTAPQTTGSTTTIEPITDESKHLSRNDIIKSLKDCKTEEEVDTLITCQSLGIAKKSEGDQVTITSAVIDRKKELSDG